MLLRDAALEVRERAHAPYSGFKVGAALRGDDGGLFVGCNVENAAYPEGTCAEAGAIAAMVVAGGRRIAAVAVAGGPGPLCTPCGSCRQRIREFAGPETPVLICDESGVLRHDGGRVSGPGADVERAVVRPWLGRLGHQRHDIGLRDRLVLVDRQGAVRIGHARQVGRHEQLARHGAHRRQHAGVPDPARLELASDHLLAARREIGVFGHRHASSFRIS